MRQTLLALALLIAGIGQLWSDPVRADDVAATVRWSQRAALGLTVSGVIQEVRVEPGQPVRAGELLLRLDPRGFEAEVARRRARIQRLAPEREEAERELARMQDLYDRTLLSDHELEMAKIANRKLAASQAEAEAALRHAELRLERSALRAPFDGIVVVRSAEPGQAVVSHCRSVPLVVVASTDRLAARAYLTLEQTRGLAPGQQLGLLARDRELTATVRFVALEPESDGEGAGRYVLDLVFEPRAEERWRVGERLRLALPGTGR